MAIETLFFALVFTFMNAMAKYVAAKISKIWNSEKQKSSGIDNLCDGSLVSRDRVHRFLHALPPHLGIKSSGAVPFTTMFALLVLSFENSVPLVFLGASFAVRGRPVKLPVRTNHIPRHIPKQQFVTSPRFLNFVSGMVPIENVYTEFFFIMSSLYNISSIVSSVSLLMRP